MTKDLTTKKDNKPLIDLQKFTGFLNKQPTENEIQTRNGFMYIPISFIEMNLDEIFFGLWETSGFRWERIFNEIVGTLELRVFHPTIKQWITRTGSGAIVIMQRSGTELVEFEQNKVKNCLEKGFPKLKAECLKNACLSLGKRFGRDLNRQYEDFYSALIKDDYTRPSERSIDYLRELIRTGKLTPIERESYTNQLDKITDEEGKLLIEKLKDLQPKFQDGNSSNKAIHQELDNKMNNPKA